MLFRFADLAVSHAFGALRLLPMSNHGKDVEILALRHQLGLVVNQVIVEARLDPADGAAGLQVVFSQT